MIDHPDIDSSLTLVCCALIWDSGFLGSQNLGHFLQRWCSFCFQSWSFAERDGLIPVLSVELERDDHLSHLKVTRGTVVLWQPVWKELSKELWQLSAFWLKVRSTLEGTPIYAEWKKFSQFRELTYFSEELDTVSFKTFVHLTSTLTVVFLRSKLQDWELLRLQRIIGCNGLWVPNTIFLFLFYFLILSFSVNK